MNPSELYDAKERRQALDPFQSFIVQAPAGSGKTELLTQRYLVLLSHVKQPEEILAITFTKKSAAEMRARIIKALKNADQHPEPTSAHEKQTWLLAKNALQRNNTLNWDLLDNPSRLQIQTIDSFNASLTRQLPLLSNFGAPLKIIDDASPLYREAVQEFLSHLEENFSWANAIEKLLLHMDNDLANVEKLLINMLRKRDQWLPYIATNANNPELRKTLESHLAHVVIDTLENLNELFPEEFAEELVSIAQFAGQNLKRDKPDAPITLCAELTALPGSNLADKSHWVSIASLLLTKSKPQTFRKSFTIAEGFPAPSSTKNAEEKQFFTAMKARIKELVDELSLCEELHNGLKDLTTLPSHSYEETHWETLDALHDILRVVVAQLKVIFQLHGQIDYIENSQAALVALGSEENPTDLTLALDYKIQHILIDEFQDTSTGQFRLLEKLIAGWESNDGRSLFVVGDPMQSIYRFREAEVGLFIRARKSGIAHLPLKSLTLSVNFRSTAEVVEWINTHFTLVFPLFEDISSGAVSYSNSMPSPSEEKSAGMIKLHPFLNANGKVQADGIVQFIQTTQKNFPQGKIAILVRSRTHLKALIPALKQANLPFRALDIEPLATRPVIQDLLALTRALLHPGDRVAWLAVLRAPWCGLLLSDLLLLAQDKNKFILLESLATAEIIKTLSSDGQLRLKRILPHLDIALTERRRYTLRHWLEYTWLQLGGPACVDQQSDLDDANAFFELIEKLDEAADLPDLKKLTEAINKLYASPNNLADESLQIMTIHNAKGLEFDTVILPHLERKASQDDKQLLQWMERPRLGAKNDLILAPIRAVGEETNSIYDYITDQQKIKASHENGRLLYVASTRAKSQLHLFFNLETKENAPNEIKKPAHNSLLEKLWPAIHTRIYENVMQKSEELAIAANPLSAQHSIKRLTTTWQNPLPFNQFAQAFSHHQKKSGFNLPQNNPKFMGTLIHQILQQISKYGAKWWTEESVLNKQIYIKRQLLQLGMQEADIDQALPRIEHAIANTLKDERGQWILASHLQAESEKPLTMIINGETKNLIIDRTFIDEKGIRWIIDYKSSELAEGLLESFLTAEQKQYEKQLLGYAHALQKLEQSPIRVGLYFPLIPAWREWNVNLAIPPADFTPLAELKT